MTAASDLSKATDKRDHDSHCFIAAPFGKDDTEHEQIMAWIRLVMFPVIDRLGLVPMIAAENAAPTPITLEIREHLAFDKLAFFLLGANLQRMC